MSERTVPFMSEYLDREDYINLAFLLDAYGGAKFGVDWAPNDAMMILGEIDGAELERLLSAANGD